MIINAGIKAIYYHSGYADELSEDMLKEAEIEIIHLVNPAAGRRLMKCPYCGEIDNKVIDSRLSKDASVIRRRRECIVCSRRFTTYEHIEEIPIVIVKKDDRREVFNREKVRSGLKKACQKRNISINVIEEFIDDLERDLRETGKRKYRLLFSGKRL